MARRVLLRWRKRSPQMSPTDRVNFLADDWAMVQAGRADPSSYLALVENIGVDDRRPVWDQIITAFSALQRLSRDRPERPALQRYVSARLRPVLDRLGWDGSGSGDDDDTLLRGSLIRTLGELGDEAVIAEAKRRFAAFLRDPKSLPAALRDSVTHVVGYRGGSRNLRHLLTLARKSTVTNERLRYYFAAAAARDPALARATLDAGPWRRGAGHDRHRTDRHRRFLRRAARTGLGFPAEKLRCVVRETGCGNSAISSSPTS